MDDGIQDHEIHPAIRGLKTVCRCNNSIAVCTTATTGHCGGSCTPDVQQMIAELAIQRPLATAAPAASAAAWWVRKK